MSDTKATRRFDERPKPPPRAVAPQLDAHVKDMQAILRSGFGTLRQCRYVLLQVVDADAARRWLAEVLAAKLVKSVADLGPDPDALRREHHPAVFTLAFSHRGLLALGIPASADHPFPSCFATGMVEPQRSRLLGDRNVRDWCWADAPVAGAAVRVVHLLVACFSEIDAAPHPLVQDAALGAGFVVVDRIDSCPAYLQPASGDEGYIVHEPFGFRDGISQPVIRGMRESRAARMARTAVGDTSYQDRVVEPGEFILGHPNGYGELAHCPGLGDLDESAPGAASDLPITANGSYLVARQIVQHTQRFQAFEAANPVQVAGAVSAAERLVGRRKNGQPLVQCPVRPKDLNDFRYREADFDGLQCPRGSHVRRSHPRDMLGHDIESGLAASKLHRLIRRGRVYARKNVGAEDTHTTRSRSDTAALQPAAEAPVEACAEGLFFIALCADLERQFEMVQTRWLANRQFNSLSADDDFTVPTGRPYEFTVQGLPSGERIVSSLGDFTSVVAGGYFFLPGLRALGIIAARWRRDDAAAV